MMSFTCKNCDSVFSAEQMPHRGEICFKCHVKTIRLGFTYGQEDFHGPTIRERQQQTVEQARINGYNAEPVTNWM
jgi:cytochrome c5